MPAARFLFISPVSLPVLLFLICDYICLHVCKCAAHERVCKCVADTRETERKRDTFNFEKHLDKSRERKKELERSAFADLNSLLSNPKYCLLLLCNGLLLFCRANFIGAALEVERNLLGKQAQPSVVIVGHFALAL